MQTEYSVNAIQYTALHQHSGAAHHFLGGLKYETDSGAQISLMLFQQFDGAA